MDHIVLGCGNLGIDLFDELRKRYEVELTKEVNIPELLRKQPKVIWCCIGAGGPGGDKLKQLAAHVDLPHAIAEAFQNTPTKIFFFSTHYLNEDPLGSRSHYALTKVNMEQFMSGYPKVRCIRIGSLYGKHRPLSTLPGKIILNANKLSRLNASVNNVTPTPTRWLAEQFVEEAIWERFFDYPKVFSYGPSGYVSVSHWIHQIMLERSLYVDKPIKVEYEEFFDGSYPLMSGGGIWVGPNWYKLWFDYGPEVISEAVNMISVTQRTEQTEAQIHQLRPSLESSE